MTKITSSTLRAVSQQLTEEIRQAHCDAKALPEEFIMMGLLQKMSALNLKIKSACDACREVEVA